MLDLTVVVVYGLAAFRVTRFLVLDTLIDRPRRVALEWLLNPPKVSWWRNLIVDLFTCQWCLGFWVSLAIVTAAGLVWPWDLGRDGWISVAAVAAVQGITAYATKPGTTAK